MFAIIDFHARYSLLATLVGDNTLYIGHFFIAVLSDLMGSMSMTRGYTSCCNTRST